MNGPSPSGRPGADEYSEFYDTYVRLVPEGNIAELLAEQESEVREFFADVTEDEAMVVHPPYSWTVKQVVGHLIDTERVFADRLHRFSSGDLQSLPGMDQEPYVEFHDYVTPTLASLVEELLHCRQANVLLVRRLRPESWSHRGIASSHPISVKALAYCLVGHVAHHLTIVRQRLRHPTPQE